MFTRFRISTNAIVGAVAILWLGNGTIQADQAPADVSVRIDPQSVIAPIPDDFIGFGYETSAVAQPDFFSAKNSRMIRLYRNLSPHGLIRIGGNISDHTRYEPEGKSLVQNEGSVTIINQASLADLGDFARATGWSVMWGLNLGTGSKEQAVEEAVAVTKALGPNLQSFQIGNEVDLMRKYSQHYDQYHNDYLEFKAAIRQQLPEAAFSGPDSAGSYSFVQQFVTSEAKDMKLATHHYYRGGKGDATATLEHLLARDTGFDDRLDRLHALCAPANISFRINEVNSFYGGGKPGVSDTFGSALWCLDYMFDLAAHGCAGVNMETDINQHAFISFYSPIVHDAAGVCSARPEYYGMVAFSLAASGDILKTESSKSDVNLTVYATRQKQAEVGGHQTIWVVMINKDLARDASVKIVPPDKFRPAMAFPLTAPSAQSTANVTLAAAGVSENGTWEPAAQGCVLPTNAGKDCFDVPHASALLLRYETR